MFMYVQVYVYSDVLCSSVYVLLLVKGACFFYFPPRLVFFPSFSLPFQSSIFFLPFPSSPLPPSPPLFPLSSFFPSTERPREEEKRINRERKKEQNTTAINLSPVTRTASPALHPPAPITGFSCRGNGTTPSVSMPRGRPSYLHWKTCTKN